MSAPLVEQNDVETLSASPPTDDPNVGSNNDTFLNTGLGDMATRTAFLALFIIVGFVGNCVLVATIAQSQRLKDFKLNLFILSAAIVNLINCIVNMPLILGNTITEKWDYGDFVCRFNAFTLQLASIAMLLGLTLMTFDRFLAVKCNDLESYTSTLTSKKASAIIIYTWVHAFGFSVPLVFGIIPVKAFPARYLCAADSGSPLIYLFLRSIFGYLIPILLIIGFFIYIGAALIREKLRQRKACKHAYAADLSPPELESRILTESNTVKYVGVLFLMWSVCEGPYLLLASVEQYKNSREFHASFDVSFEYPWELDLSFTWMKLSYAIVLPIVTFFWRKEVWQKFKNCVLCRKSNLVVDSLPRRHRHLKKKDEPRRIAIEQNKVDMNSNGSSAVPVLFATPEGLHFQTFANNEWESSDNKSTDVELGLDNSKTHEVSTTVTAKKCDVFGSQNLLDFEEGDTSDYDSEMDPFSGSNPISVHTKGSIENKSRHNSSSVETDKKEKRAGCEPIDTKEGECDGEPGLENRDREKPKKKKAKVKSDASTLEQAVEEIDQGIEEDRNDHDSGRGSYGENSLKAKRKKKKRDSVENEDPLAVVPVANAENQEVPVDPVAPNQNIMPKKKKKAKKKTKVGDVAFVDNAGYVRDTTEENWGSTRRPIPALRRPAPASLNPIENRDQYLNKIPSTETDLRLDDLSCLPDLSETGGGRRHRRQLSADAKQNDEDTDSTKVFARSVSESAVLRDIEVPKPAPRKSRPKISMMEGKDDGGCPADSKGSGTGAEGEKSKGSGTAVEGDKSKGGGTVAEGEKPKRKERRRTTSQSTNDSQTMLLGNSNTSTDLSDLQELNRHPAKRLAEQGEGRTEQKPKKTKKKTQASDVKKNESRQDLTEQPKP